MASQSQGQKKPTISDFFKPRSQVPQKRPSPSGESSPTTGRPSKARSPTPKTPATSARFKDVSKSPFKSPFAPSPAPSLPIRSPRPSKQENKPTYGRVPLFKRQGSSIPTSPISPLVKSPKRSFFADVQTTAQSVVEDGKVVAVRDSDEDTDSLASLEDIFGRRQEESATSSSSPPELDEAAAEAERTRTLSLFTRGRSDPLVGRDKLRALASKEREHKFDISKLIGDHLDDDEFEDNLRKARKGYENSSRDAEQHIEQQDVDRRLLASLMTTENAEDDEVARLMGAFKRTDAFDSERIFSFFGPQGLSDRVDELPAELGSEEELPSGNLWRKEDPTSRDRAFLSGWVAESAAKGMVDDSILSWTFNNVLLEQKDELRQAYIRTLEYGSVHWTRINLSARDVQNMFQYLGANADVLRDGSDINPKPALKDPARKDPKYLLSALELFRAVAHDMDFAALSKLTSLLIRLALDANVMSDGRVSLAVDGTLSVLLGLPDFEARHHVVERLLSDAGSQLHERSLQICLLSHIQPISPFAARVRLVLAHRFLFGSKARLTIENDRQISLSQFAKHLHTSGLNIHTDRRKDVVEYANVRAMTQLFDVATMDGGQPASFRSHADEMTFNHQVDSLADGIKAIFSSIADAGASHMRRTEAKDALQALYYRLIYGVRTEPRPKKNIFGRDGDEYRNEERSKGFMSKFLAKQAVKREKAVSSKDMEAPAV